jgi:hypothetical protein
MRWKITRQMYRFYRSKWLGLSLILAATGCQANNHAVPLSPQKPLPVAGPWGDELAGLKARVRVGSDHVDETGNLLAAVEIVNHSDRPMTVPNTRVEDGVTWSIGPTMFFGSKLPGEIRQVTVRPGSSAIIGPVSLPIAPSVNPRPGPQGIACSMSTSAGWLSAPPHLVSITPATWGPLEQGVRVCLGPGTIIVTPTTRIIRLHLYVHNARYAPLQFPVIDWAWPDVRSEDGVITLSYQAPEAGKKIRHPLGLIQRQVLDVSQVFTRDGFYRVRVEINGVRAGVATRRATSSGATTSTSPDPFTLISNEIALRISSSGSN